MYGGTVLLAHLSADDSSTWFCGQYQQLGELPQGLLTERFGHDHLKEYEVVHAVRRWLAERNLRPQKRSRYVEGQFLHIVSSDRQRSQSIDDQSK